MIRPLGRWAVRLLPRRFRERHGAEMRAFWEALALEPRFRGPLGRLRLGLHVVGDACWTSLRVRRRQSGDGRVHGTGRWTMGRGSSIRQAWRGLRRNPLFGGVAVGTLSLGVAATTAVFAVTWGVLLEPLDFPSADDLVVIERGGEGVASTSWPDFRDWREEAAGVIDVAAWAETSGTFRWEEGARNLQGARISRNLFDVLAVPPALGRPFVPEEAAFDGPEAVILSHGLFETQFGADPGIVGRTVQIGAEQVPVVGVMPEGFAFPGPEARYWLPLHEDRVLRDAGLATGTRDLSFLQVIGRLAGPREQVEPRFRTIVEAVYEAHPRDSATGTPVIRTLRELIVGDAGTTLGFLLAAAGLVLVVAGANVAALSLSRADDRTREVRIRAAIGADRRALRGQLLTESLVVAGLAAAVGIPVAALLVRLLLALAPEGLPRLAEIGLDPVAIGFGLAVALFTGLLFGLAPAIRAGRRGAPTEAALQSGRGAISTGTRFQSALVAAQVGAAVVLLTGASLLLRSYRSLTAEELGFHPESVVSALVLVPDGIREDPAERDLLYTRILDRIRGLPGVTSATSTYSPPLSQNQFFLTIADADAVEPAEDAPLVETVIVRDQFLETLGLPLLAGRGFGPGDDLEAPPVAMVNRAMAERFWPGEDPIGKRFVHTGGLRGSVDGFERAFFPREPYTVVGVVGDMRTESLAEEPAPQLFRPHAQITWGTQYLLVRTTGDPSEVAEALPGIVWEIDDRIPVERVSTLEREIAATAAMPRFRTLILSAFALTNAVLAMVGLYGVMALTVARRRREFGVRIALGATRERLLSTVLRQGLALAAIGAIVGAAVAFLVSDTLETLLYRVAPTEPLTYLSVIGAVLLVALAASWLPAARAGKVDPVRTLAGE